MKKFLSLFIIIIFVISLFGCQSDSTTQDTNEESTLDRKDVINLAWDYYFNGQFEPAEFMFKKIIAGKNDDEFAQKAYLGLGNIYYHRSILCLKKNDLKNAEKSFQTAIDYYLWARYLKKDDPDVLIGLANVYFETTRYFFNKNDIKKATDYSKVGLAILDEVSKLDIRDKKILGNIFLLRGNFYHYLNDLKNAIENYEKYLVVVGTNSIQAKEVEHTVEILRKKINQ